MPDITNSRIHFQAFLGGEIDLSSTTSIDEFQTADSRYSRVYILADGARSKVDLSALESFIDTSGTSSSGNGLWSYLDAVRGGTVLAENLRDVRGLDLNAQNVATPLLTTLHQGQLLLQGQQDIAFDELISLSSTTV